jgi:hypothetical protein
MSRNSAVEPLRRAKKPCPTIDGSGNAEEAMNDEHSIKGRPYISGSMKGSIPPFFISEKN